ncbi:Serine/threonine-protein kinase plk1 [Chamberlinius hualienensis]
MATRVTTQQSTVAKDTVPTVIVDATTKRSYRRGQFMGKGGFAKCYELTDLESHQVFAGKVVPKSLLSKPYHKDKMAQEINIHRGLNHPNIVQFYSFFEDSENVYILLELCRRKSMMELHKRRKTLTEAECRYFVRQIVSACCYLQERKIIHRDLKLGNIFLDDEMQVKIGDFGLATKLDFEGERKRTLCGTPNYIAPEILCKKGHSFEVDVWSLGCIIYTLLVGRPPFETSNLKETYAKIKKNEYEIPNRVPPLARNLIQSLLHPDPTKRPSMDTILYDSFMTTGYIPSRLPTSCLTTAPRFDCNASFVGVSTQRRPLLEVNKNDPVVSILATKKNAPLKKVPLSNDPPKPVPIATPDDFTDKDEELKMPKDCYLSELLRQTTELLAKKPQDKLHIQMDEAEDPAASPMLWVSKWVDYSDKYGLGYCLCDNSVGVIFNDATKIVLLADGENFHYIERDGKENYYTTKQYPSDLQKKVTLLTYFRNYMTEHLLTTGAGIVPRDGDQLARLPYMRSWFRTKSAIVLHLTNGTLQVNFLEDHTKVILCPLMSAVTYIDSSAECRTYRLNLLDKWGCSREVYQRLRYTSSMIDKLMSPKGNSVRP